MAPIPATLGRGHRARRAPRGRAGPASSRGRPALAAIAAAVALAGCGGPAEPGIALLECERLAFVPRGSCAPFPRVRCVAYQDLLVDRFEVTRALWRAVAEDAPEVGDLDGRLGEDWSVGSPHLPAVGMGYAEAEAFARARDMRLLTVGEWIYVAAGSRAQYWPYGNSRGTSVANTLEVGLRRSAPVGTFPRGQSSATGVHDLIGNVWEWVSPPLPAFAEPLGWPGADRSPYPVWAMGGSYLSRAQELYDAGRRRFNAQGLEPGHRARDLGLRCAVEAAPYLWRGAARWSDPALRERVVAAGARWGSPAVALLEDLSRRSGAAPALAWLLEGARR